MTRRQITKLELLDRLGACHGKLGYLSGLLHRCAPYIPSDNADLISKIAEVQGKEWWVETTTWNELVKKFRDKSQ